MWYEQRDVKLRAGRYLVPAKVLVGEDDIGLRFRYNRDLITEIKAAFEKRKWDKTERVWTFPDTPRNRFVLRYLMGMPVYEPYNGVVEVSDTLDRAINRPLYHHQKEAMVHLLERKQCILAGEMGVGKTLAVIQALDHLSATDIWYVAPKSALAAVQNEFQKWGAKTYPRFMTYDGMRRVLAHWADRKLPPCFAIFDESSRLKNPGTKRWKAAKHLTDAMREERRNPFIWLMSGSPAPHDPTDWWGQAELACPGFLKERNRNDMRSRIGEIEMRQAPAGHMYPHLLRWLDEEVELLHKRLQGLVLFQLKKDCLDLPDKVYQVIPLEPTAEVKRAAYMLAETADNPLAALTSCRMLSDGVLKKPDGSFISVKVPKDDALFDIMETHEDRLIVFAGFTEAVNKICDLVVKAGWQVIRYDGRGLWSTLSGLHSLKEAERRFQEEDSTPIVWVGQAGAGGMGLTLTRSPTIVYYSNDFNAESRIQSEDRIHRIGTTKATIIDLIHLGTDQLTRDNVMTKRGLQATTMGEILEVLS